MTQFIDVSKGVEKEKKDTVFTYYKSGLHGWRLANGKPEHYEKVIYLGKCSLENDDIFAAYKDNGNISIFKGTKGDEFNNQ